MKQKPILYSGTKNASSWAMRAWLALKAARYEFHEVIVDIQRPQRFPNLSKIASFSPPGCVPVLDTGSAIIFDSNAIMEFANDIAEGALLPTNMEMRARARAMTAWQHSGLSMICSRISFESAFYPYKRALKLDEQSQARRLLSTYEYCLDDSGGPYLFGAISLADFMHAPAVIRLHRHKVDTDGLPKTKRWMQDLLSYPYLAEWLADADEQPPIWYDDYLIPNDPPEVALARDNAVTELL